MGNPAQRKRTQPQTEADGARTHCSHKAGSPWRLANAGTRRQRAGGVWRACRLVHMDASVLLPVLEGRPVAITDSYGPSVLSDPANAHTGSRQATSRPTSGTMTRLATSTSLGSVSETAEVGNTGGGASSSKYAVTVAAFAGGSAATMSVEQLTPSTTHGTSGRSSAVFAKLYHDNGFQAFRVWFASHATGPGMLAVLHEDLLLAWLRQLLPLRTQHYRLCLADMFTRPGMAGLLFQDMFVMTSMVVALHDDRGAEFVYHHARHLFLMLAVPIASTRPLIQQLPSVCALPSSSLPLSCTPTHHWRERIALLTSAPAVWPRPGLASSHAGAATGAGAASASGSGSGGGGGATGSSVGTSIVFSVDAAATSASAARSGSGAAAGAAAGSPRMASPHGEDPLIADRVVSQARVLQLAYLCDRLCEMSLLLQDWNIFGFLAFDEFEVVLFHILSARRRGQQRPDSFQAGRRPAKHYDDGDDHEASRRGCCSIA